jgi:hypothetical protein
MGLFSSKAVEGKVFAERELDFNKAELQKSVVKRSEQLYAYRHDESHTAFADYLRELLNLEILQLSEGKLDQEFFAYHRGRIDALRHALNLREKFIQDVDNLRKGPDKSQDANGAKRSYVRSPSTQAGLSI